jgi:hypothetical protein
MFVMAFLAQTQTYNQHWKKVEKMVKKDLPQSVVEEAEIIFEKAKEERNVPEMMKAYLAIMRYHGHVSGDYWQEDISKLKQWAEDETSPVYKASLYSILGMELMNTMDAKEAIQYLRRSLEPAEALLEVPANEMQPLAIDGKTSKTYLKNNLYELLARRAIKAWVDGYWKACRVGNQNMIFPDEMNTLDGLMNTPFPPVSEYDVVADIIAVYQTLLKYYQQEGNREALLLTALEAYDTMKFLPGGKKEKFELQLRSLMTEFADVEACAEVYISLMAYTDMGDAERLAMIRKGMVSYPNYPRFNKLKELEEMLISSSFELRCAQAYPGDSIAFVVLHRNMGAVKMVAYRVDMPVVSLNKDAVNENNIGDYGKEVFQKEYRLIPGKEYEKKDTCLFLPPLPTGVYYVVAHDLSKKMTDTKIGKFLHVSSLYGLERATIGEKYQVAIVDRKTGHPVPQGEITLFDWDKEEMTPRYSYQSNERGLATFIPDWSKRVVYQLRTPKDSAMDINSDYFSSYLGYKPETKSQVVRLFTDRSVYRPDQKVKVSGMAYSSEGDRLNVDKALKCVLVLCDPFGKVLEKREVSSDAFGVFGSEFVLPQGRVNGQYGLVAKVKNKTLSEIYFHVEEYKRPTFEVKFDPMTAEFKAGDVVEFVGMARNYSGVPVQHAKVQYTMAVRENSWWYSGDEIHREMGEVVTDVEGCFKLQVRLPDLKGKGYWYYDCLLEADVTSLSGETQSGSLTVPLGCSSVIVGMKDWDQTVIQKELSKEMCFSVTNLMGEKVDARVDYRVFRLTGDSDEPMLVLEGIQQGNRKWNPKDIYALPSGKYRVIAGTKDKQGRRTETEADFVVFSGNDRQVPYGTPLWCHQSASVFEDDRPVTLWIGTSKKDVYLFYDVFTEDSHLVSESILMTDTLQQFDFRYKPEYGDGIFVSVAFVKDNRLHKQEFKIVKSEPDKRLVLNWKTFRDKLRPGDKEQWTLTVRKPDGTPVSANLMATLYDASLDALVEHRWSFEHEYSRFIPMVSWDAIYLRNMSLFFYHKYKSWKYPAMQYSRFWHPQELEWQPLFEIVDYDSDVEVLFEEEIIPVQNDGLVARSFAASRKSSDVSLANNASVASGKKGAQVRTNFGETAFFSPNLRTDEKGEVSFSFTLPESLTRWKFMGLAHTRQMDYGQLEAMAVASKDFMLQPQLPRFVRMGDKATLSAMVMNLTDKPVKGLVRLELFDPETEKVWLALKQKFAVSAKGSEAVHFNFEVTDRYPLLAARMVAEGNGFSDGEQRYLPVLSDKRWMTETLPLYINGNETRTFPMDDLFNQHSRTAVGHRLTVEMTSNPSWYAVQALPALSNPSAEDAFSWAVAHYANTLASYIVGVHPSIREVVDSWQSQGESLENFMSQLQKNEELREILLEETPWLMEAEDEAEQYRRLTTLFDVAQMENRLAESASRLGNLQTADGAWSWFSGMPGSRFVTTQVVEMLARLQALTGRWDDARIQEMYTRGLKYLAKRMEAEVIEMKKAEKEGVKGGLPSEDALRYLYICSLDANIHPDKTVTDYLVNRLTKMTWVLTTYGKAKCALILQHFGETKTARMFLKSLLEYTVMNDEMGRYFDTRYAEYSWFSYKIPVQVAAIEAVKLLDGDERTMNELKRWLLKQKQTQSWGTPLATADAIYALLCTGTDMLSERNRVSVTLGDVVVRTPDDALGYVKQTFEKEVTEIREAVVKNEGKVIAWGALYAQYLEDMDQVLAHGKSLAVGRSLYKNGQPLGEGDVLQVGDKLTVRLTITADRDMDFVQVKDERAACLEPVEALSGYRWNQRIGYYQETKDASTSFFFDQMRKGKYELEYEVYVTSLGEYQQGIATVQSVYAPEFNGHGKGGRLIVK